MHPTSCRANTKTCSVHWKRVWWKCLHVDMHSVGDLTTSCCILNKNTCCGYNDFKWINDGVNAILLVLKLVETICHGMQCFAWLQKFSSSPRKKYNYPKASGIQCPDQWLFKNSYPWNGHGLCVLHGCSWDNLCWGHLLHSLEGFFLLGLVQVGCRAAISRYLKENKAKLNKIILLLKILKIWCTSS